MAALDIQQTISTLPAKSIRTLHTHPDLPMLPPVAGLRREVLLAPQFGLSEKFEAIDAK